VFEFNIFSIQVMSVVALLLGLWLSGRLNRRPMLLVGFFGSAVAHLFTALSCWLLPQGNLKGIVVLCLLLLFCLFMQASVTTVTWSMLAEIFPLRARGISSFL
jgi:major inositol transporter-like SP family MFS transporter